MAGQQIFIYSHSAIGDLASLSSYHMESQPSHSRSCARVQAHVARDHGSMVVEMHLSPYH